MSRECSNVRNRITTKTHVAIALALIFCLTIYDSIAERIALAGPIKITSC
jgi:hypothetical protein